MVHLDITNDEKAILTDVLKNYISDLRMEIADTDKMDFRKKLKDRKEALNKVLSELQKQD